MLFRNRDETIIYVMPPTDLDILNNFEGYQNIRYFIGKVLFVSCF